MDEETKDQVGRWGWVTMVGGALAIIIGMQQEPGSGVGFITIGGLACLVAVVLLIAGGRVFPSR